MTFYIFFLQFKYYMTARKGLGRKREVGRGGRGQGKVRMIVKNVLFAYINLSKKMKVI